MADLNVALRVSVPGQDGGRVSAPENAELRHQLVTTQDLPMETAIDVGHLHVCIEAVTAE